VLVVADPFYFSLKEVLGDFTKETGIEVQLESLAYDALQARLVSSFVSKTSDADVITVDQMWSGQYLDNGWITPLDDMIKSDKEIKLDDFIPEVLYSLNTWRGKFVTLPVAAYAQGTIYRTDVFKELGLTPPDQIAAKDWTWDKYLETLKAIQGKEVGGKKLFGTVICGSQPVPIVHMFTQVAASFGGRWFKKFPEAPWDFDPEIASDTMVKAAEFYKELYDLSPPESINYVWYDAGTRFAQGDIGMFYWWTPYFYLVKDTGYMTGHDSTVIDKYAAAALPVAGDTPQTISLGGWSLGIPSSSAKSEQAFKFIKWAVSAETQKKMALVPKYHYQFSDFARPSLYQDPEIRKIYPYLDVQMAMMKMGNGKIARPPVPVYSTLEGILGLQLNNVISGDTEAADAMGQTKTLFTNVLKGNFLIPYSLPSYDDTLDNTKKLIQSLA
jgi:multiple sugar transport system substrate-binding protein